MLSIKRNSRDYKSKLKKFKEFCYNKDRMTHPYNSYLIFDVDDLQYKLTSEWNITYNQIVVAQCQIPAKKDKDVIPTIKEITYAWE